MITHPAPSYTLARTSWIDPQPTWDKLQTIGLIGNGQHLAAEGRWTLYDLHCVKAARNSAHQIGLGDHTSYDGKSDRVQQLEALEALFAAYPNLRAVPGNHDGRSLSQRNDKWDWSKWVENVGPSFWNVTIGNTRFIGVPYRPEVGHWQYLADQVRGRTDPWCLVTHGVWRDDHDNIFRPIRDKIKALNPKPALVISSHSHDYQTFESGIVWIQRGYTLQRDKMFEIYLEFRGAAVTIHEPSGALMMPLPQAIDLTAGTPVEPPVDPCADVKAERDVLQDQLNRISAITNE